MAGKQSSKEAARQRHMWVFIGLTGSLTATALLLHLISPVPLAPQAGPSLSAQEPVEGFHRVVDQPAAVAPVAWRTIYIHHSKTSEGDVRSLGRHDTGLGDHFLIGNGAGAADGELQLGHRWDQQLAAAPPDGLPSLDRNCISICLVGDYDRTSPTEAQLAQLARLLSYLQQKFAIPESAVYLRNQPDKAAGIGTHFPVHELKKHLARR